jgi:hypothetical protein
VRTVGSERGRVCGRGGCGWPGRPSWADVGGGGTGFGVGVALGGVAVLVRCRRGVQFVLCPPGIVLVVGSLLAGVVGIVRVV